MASSAKRKSLAEQLAQEFSSTVPLFDPEDNLNDDTAAKVTEADYEIDEVEDDPSTSAYVPSQLRRKNIRLLADEDSKYIGRKVSRQSLRQQTVHEMSGSDSEYSVEESEPEEDDDDEEIDSDEFGADPAAEDDMEMLDEKSTGSSEYSDSDDDTDDSDREEDSSDTENVQHDKELEKLLYDNISNLSHNKTIEDDDGDDAQLMAKSNQQADLEKGQAIQNQINIWESVLGMRIELQKLLQSSNQLPQCSNWEQIMSTEQTDDPRNSQLISADYITEVQNALLDLSKSMLTLQQRLTGIDSGEQTDESSSDDVKHNMQEMDSEISKSYDGSMQHWNTVIQKWDDRTRLAVSTGSKKKRTTVVDPVLQQIKQILTDRMRLLSRTQMNRSTCKIIGKPQHISQPVEKSEESLEPKQSYEQDPEIFNDEDFYHNLLKEFIEQKSKDSLTMSKKWMEFQNMRKRCQEPHDRAGTKERKLRFDVIPKLVNFMAPVVDPFEWGDEQKDELFSSLFGVKTNYSAFAIAEANEAAEKEAAEKAAVETNAEENHQSTSDDESEDNETSKTDEEGTGISIFR